MKFLIQIEHRTRKFFDLWKKIKFYELVQDYDSEDDCFEQEHLKFIHHLMQIDDGPYDFTVSVCPFGNLSLKQQRKYNEMMRINREL